MDDINGHVIILDRLLAKGNMSDELNGVEFSPEKFAALISLPIENATMYTLAIGSLRLPLVSSMRLHPIIEDQAKTDNDNTLSLTVEDRSIFLKLSAVSLFVNWHSALGEALADLVIGDLFHCNGYEPSESLIREATIKLKSLVTTNHESFHRIQILQQLRRELSEYLKSTSLTSNRQAVNDLLNRAFQTKILVNDPKYKALRKIALNQSTPPRFNSNNTKRIESSESQQQTVGDENTPNNRIRPSAETAGIAEGSNGKKNKKTRTPLKNSQTAPPPAEVVATEAAAMESTRDDHNECEVLAEPQVSSVDVADSPVSLLEESAATTSADVSPSLSEVKVLPLEVTNTTATATFQPHHSPAGRIRRSTKRRLSGVIMLVVMVLLSLALSTLWSSSSVNGSIGSSVNTFLSIMTADTPEGAHTTTTVDDVPLRKAVTLEEVRRDYQEALRQLLLVQQQTRSTSSDSDGITISENDDSVSGSSSDASRPSSASATAAAYSKEALTSEIPWSSDDSSSNSGGGIELQIKVGRPPRLSEALKESKSRLRHRIAAAVKAVVRSVGGAVWSVMSVFIFGREELEAVPLM